MSTMPERLPADPGDVASAAMRAMLEMVLGVRLVMTGRLEPERLARATRLLTDLEPVLGCWYRTGVQRDEWVLCAEIDEAALLETVETDDPESVAARFHGAGFADRGPRIAVALLRCADHDEVCIRMDHVAGDGWSAMEVAHLLAETYTRLARDPGYAPEPRGPRPALADVLAALTPEQRAAATASPPFAAGNWTGRLARGSSHEARSRTLTLPAGRVAAVRTYAHERGATVNDALVAAMLRSAGAPAPPSVRAKPSVSISADTRRFARDSRFERVANISTTQNVVVDYAVGQTFDETLAAVVAATKVYRETLWSIAADGGPASIDSPLLTRGMFRLITAMMHMTHVVALIDMNLGAFDESRLLFDGAAPEAAYALGPLPRFAGFPTLVSFYRGTCTLCVAFRDAEIADGAVEAYLVGIDSALAVA